LAEQKRKEGKTVFHHYCCFHQQPNEYITISMILLRKNARAKKILTYVKNKKYRRNDNRFTIFVLPNIT